MGIYWREREREERTRYIMCTLKKCERERESLVYFTKKINIYIYYTYVGLSGNGDYPKEKPSSLPRN